MFLVEDFHPMNTEAAAQDMEFRLVDPSRRRFQLQWSDGRSGNRRSVGSPGRTAGLMRPGTFDAPPSGPMPAQAVSPGPACWSFGSGIVTNEPMIHAGRTASECDAPTMPKPKLDSTAEVWTLLPIGTVLQGKYRLDRLLGIGAMGSVFAATHLRNANRVAVKILHPDFAKKGEARTRFLREGYAANSVGHAGTVRVFDDHTADDGAVFLVMELLEGETLAARWERSGRRLRPREVTQLMCQLLDILSAAHERGIVHRDVKPENLFIERDGTLRVLDFGVARVLEGALTETRAGSVIGTLPYMAPEQMLGKSHEVDARSDIWSVGATAFALVSGRFVHEAETPEEMLVFTASRQAPSLASVAPQVPRAFIQAVDRALRFDKRERWPSALAMQLAFAEASPSTRAEEEVQDSDGESSPGDVGAASHEPPIAGSNKTAPTTRIVARWTLGAVVAVAVAGAVASLVAHDRRGLPSAGATALVQPPAPLPPFASRGAVRVAEADPSGARATAPDLDGWAAAVVAPTAIGTAALDRSSERVPEAPKDVTAKPLSAARRIADVEWALTLPQPRVDPPAPAACTPPFTLVGVTGKKIWKRECL